MKKMLITGFEPFGGERVNPSWEAVKALPFKIGLFEIEKAELPVVFSKASWLAIEKAEEIKADCVILVGQAGGRDAVTPEMVGINLRHASIPDNEGNQMSDERIDENAPDAYFSTLPVRKMAKRISNHGISAKVSYSAGAYVCNDTLFSLLNHFHGTSVKVCFIHVPFVKGQKPGQPEMELKDMVKALMCAVEAIDEAALLR
ncbi:MAG: pyroglutamyl-peptidase I [Clostridia bacterium]|nr:pyroglutamyl-peptidase I [Clostridia bacterium]